MGNERITEKIVRSKLEKFHYFKNNEIKVEEQQSKNIVIDRLLSKSSKTNSGKKGFPEFIISKTKSKLVIVIE